MLAPFSCMVAKGSQRQFAGMATTFNRLQLINAALLAQGQTELDEENDGSLEWRTLAAQWPLLVEGELEDGGYSHLFTEVELVSRIGDGRFGYSDRFFVPDDAIHVRRIFVEHSDDSRTYQDDWYQDGGGVNVNQSEGVWAEVVEAVEAEDFSANFARGIQKKLEMHIARALKEEHALGDRLEAEAQAFLQRARTASANKSGPKPLFRPSSKFADARFQRSGLNHRG